MEEVNLTKGRISRHNSWGIAEDASPESALLLASISRIPSQSDLNLMTEQVTDWPSFLSLAHRHRVISLAAQRLSRVCGIPPDIARTLQRDWWRHTAISLLQIAEGLRLTRLLEAEGIACLVLKGAPLSMRIYGQPTLRDSRDVDLLIEPRSLRRAEEILEDAGLRLEKPNCRRGMGRALFLHYSHEYLLTTPTGILVELKTRLQPTGALLPLSVSSVLERRVRISASGASLPALADEDLLLYLCGHGARHCWFRLKWLADIAGLLTESTPAGLDDLLSSAGRLGFEVPVLEALALAHDWLGSEIPQSMLKRARQHPMVRRRRPLIEAAVLETAAMPFRKAGFGRMVDYSEYLLRNDLRYRAAVLERHLMTRMTAALRRFRAPAGWHL